MIEPRATMTFRCACDRCGKSQEGWYDDPEQAKDAAQNEGFVVDNWLINGRAPRQTIFCRDCVNKDPSP